MYRPILLNKKKGNVEVLCPCAKKNKSMKKYA